MIKKIVTYPNRILKKISVLVSNFDEDLHALLDDMYETMIEHNGIGLAAIQIGVESRVFIINLIRDGEEEKQYKEDLIEVINPKILDKEGEITYQEGCLSVPEYYEDIKRAEKIDVEYCDRFGNVVKESYEGLMAVAFQHELDHLDGHIFIEKLNIIKRKKFEKEWKKKYKGKKRF